MLETKTVPILPHVTMDESHVEAGESGIGAGCPIQTMERMRHFGMESEHGQTLIRVLKTIYAPRLWELGRQVDPDRTQH